MTYMTWNDIMKGFMVWHLILKSSIEMPAGFMVMSSDWAVANVLRQIFVGKQFRYEDQSRIYGVISTDLKSSVAKL